MSITDPDASVPLGCAALRPAPRVRGRAHGRVTRRASTIAAFLARDSVLAIER
ncbi:hypothetical protein HLB44_20995 [Aquincola sp. S2]|uniref:Uncharacterized protein n=1 Tax=Pseudaquabacterium terrae TaxID=2732868 RepID=A0ABX2ELG1_9BURK|nr:hypothetical protein [Aquabacterium terrae]NRF69483.1 hypothetical protein [Aquabacterium terrae]